jgi:hypothetical protein
MNKLVTLLYSCAAGLEQAYLTYETMQEARKLAASVPMLERPVKAPIGFTPNKPPSENPATPFTFNEG